MKVSKSGQATSENDKAGGKPKRRAWLPVTAGVLVITAGAYHYIKLTRPTAKQVLVVKAIGTGKVDPDVKRRLQAEYGDRVAFEENTNSTLPQVAAAPAPKPAGAAQPSGTPAATPSIQVAKLDPLPVAPPGVANVPSVAPALPGGPAGPNVVPPTAATPAQAPAAQSPTAPAATSPAPAQTSVPSMQSAAAGPDARSASLASQSAGCACSVDSPAPSTSSVRPSGSRAASGAARRSGGSAPSSTAPVARTPAEKAEVAFRLAAQRINEGRVGEAIVSAKSALAHQPSHAGAKQMLVSLLIEEKRYPEVRAFLAEQLEAQPDQPSLAMTLARITLETGDTGGAISVLQRHAAAGAQSAPYRGFAAGLLQKAGRHQEAIEEFRAATDLAPRTGAYWIGMGTSQEALGEDAKAVESYRRAQKSLGLTPTALRTVQARLDRLGPSAEEAPVAAAAPTR